MRGDINDEQAAVLRRVVRGGDDGYVFDLKTEGGAVIELSDHGFVLLIDEDYCTATAAGTKWISRNERKVQP